MAKSKFSQGLSAAILVAGVELAVLCAGFPFAVPSANAQFFFEERYPFNDPRRRRMFDPFFQDEPAPRVDYSRAPAAKKPEVAPSTKILVVGDSMADWLAYGLEDALSETPELGVVRKPKHNSGLIRYENRNNAPEWSQVIRDLVAAEKPQAIIMMLGLQDRQALRERPAPPKDPKAPAATDPKPAATAKPGEQKPAEQKSADQKPAEQQKQSNADDEETPDIAAPESKRVARPGALHEFRSERWEEFYAQRVDETIAAMKAANIPVIWVGLPSIRGPKSTSDALYLNEIYRARADNAGIVYVDVWDGFVDDNGRFTTQGPDFEGQTRRLRTADGVHFTKAGARKLAHYVDRELRRMLSTAALPVALPVPEIVQPEPSRPGAPAARPLAGPVLVLTNNSEDQTELLGGNANRTAAPDPVAASVLTKGEPLAPAAGRADDFSWPPRLPNTQMSEPLPPTGPPIAITRALPPVPNAVQASQAAPAGLPARPAQRVARQTPPPVA
ncbi:MAG: DUF459 domain-containing protein, partial [Pseudorhodoplanes sp.]|nr:DUF459 domain-containing protein [Pseudorhodoplanes sp.]